MSDIVITRKHSLGVRKARIAAERVAADPQAAFALDCAWREANVPTFERPGVNGELRLARHEVTSSVRLGLFLLPFAGRSSARFMGIRQGVRLTQRAATGWGAVGGRQRMVADGSSHPISSRSSAS